MRPLSFARRLVLMSRRSFSSSPPRDIKRPRLAGLTPDDYRNGVMLAPMVRSGARTLDHSAFPILISVFSVPTRLFALKHGAKLVWGPEMVDKAMLNSERVVDRGSPVLLSYGIR
jgi:tRNA-dihydrouridine synthase 2